MPDHHLLNRLFSHGGREKYPPTALNWVLAVPNLIHTYIYTDIHIGETAASRQTAILDRQTAILEKLPKDLQRKLHAGIHAEIEPWDYCTEDRIGAIQRRKQQNGLNK